MDTNKIESRWTLLGGGFLLVATVLYTGVALYRVTHRPTAVTNLELSETDRRDLKTSLEKIIREDLTNNKSAKKINSIQIAEPEPLDTDHIVVRYEFSYDDEKDESATHDITAAVRLEKKQDGWQIEKVTTNDENLKFASPLVIQSQLQNH